MACPSTHSGRALHGPGSRRGLLLAAGDPSHSAACVRRHGEDAVAVLALWPLCLTPRGGSDGDSQVGWCFCGQATSPGRSPPGVARPTPLHSQRRKTLRRPHRPAPGPWHDRPTVHHGHQLFFARAFAAALPAVLEEAACASPAREETRTHGEGDLRTLLPSPGTRTAAAGHLSPASGLFPSDTSWGHRELDGTARLELVEGGGRGRHLLPTAATPWLLDARVGREGAETPAPTSWPAPACPPQFRHL